MPGNGARDDKESRMFCVTRGMPLPVVVCTNEDQNSYSLKRPPPRQSDDWTCPWLMDLAFSGPCPCHLHKFWVKKGSWRPFLQCWIMGESCWGAWREEHRPQIDPNSREQSWTQSVSNDNGLLFSFTPKTDTDCVSRKCCCRGCSLITLSWLHKTKQTGFFFYVPYDLHLVWLTSVCTYWKKYIVLQTHEVCFKWQKLSFTYNNFFKYIIKSFKYK